MEQIFDHQDWKTIILNSKIVNKQNENPVKVKKTNNFNSIASKIEKKADNDDLKHTKIPDDLRIKIIQKRNCLKLTQKDLAIKCNLPISIINEIENGKAIYNHKNINTIKRVLKIS